MLINGGLHKSVFVSQHERINLNFGHVVINIKLYLICSLNRIYCCAHHGEVFFHKIKECGRII